MQWKKPFSPLQDAQWKVVLITKPALWVRHIGDIRREISPHGRRAVGGVYVAAEVRTFRAFTAEHACESLAVRATW